MKSERRARIAEAQPQAHVIAVHLQQRWRLRLLRVRRAHERVQGLDEALEQILEAAGRSRVHRYRPAAVPVRPRGMRLMRAGIG